MPWKGFQKRNTHPTHALMDFHARRDVHKANRALFPQRLDSDCFPAPSGQTRPHVEGLRAGDQGKGGRPSRAFCPGH